MRRCLGCMREYDETFDLCPECGYVAGTPAESLLHLAPGTRLAGRYLLGRVLGQGGFGITYIAWDEKLDRAVAVKEYMPRAYASRTQGVPNVTCFNDVARTQFRAGLEKVLKETRTLAKFNDLESVVRVYDCIEENDTAYIIMELLRGSTVRQAMRENGTFSFEETAQIILPVLQTLRQIHRTGLIHRDISPDNLFLCDNGKVKLLDFGSARIVSGMNPQKLSVVLKPGYAPKEQYSARGAQGPWTDLYSVAATMYKMLTGETPVDSLSRSADDDPLEPIDRLVRIPDEAAEAIMKALAIEPEDRTQTADELLETLLQFVDAPAQIQLRGTGRAIRNRSRVKKLLCILSVIVVLLGGAFAARRILSRPKPVPGDTIQPPKVSDSADLKAYASVRDKLTASFAKDASFASDTSKDEPGYLRTLTDARNGRTLTERYDAAGARTESLLEIGGGDRPDAAVRFGADGSVADVTENVYDKDGRPETSAHYGADGALTGCEKYIYDGNVQTRTQYFDASLQCVAEDVRSEENGQVQSVSKASVTTGEDGLSYREQTSEVNYTYNDKKKLTELEEHDADGKPIRLEKYADGKLSQIVLYKNGRKTEDRTFEYDAQDRLTQEKLYDNGETLTRATAYEYDDAGTLMRIVQRDRDREQIAAWEFLYDEESGAFIGIRSRSKDDLPTREQYTDGRYTVCEYKDKTLKFSETYDADGVKTGYVNVTQNEDGRIALKEIFTIEDGEEQRVGYVEYGYDGRAHSESEYDADDKLIKESFYTEDDELYSETTFDGEDKPIEEINYMENGMAEQRSVHTYDDRGREIRLERYGKDDELLDVETTLYHTNGKVQLITFRNGDDVLRTESEFNNKGVRIRFLEAQWDDSSEPPRVTSYIETKYDDLEREIAVIEYDAKMHETKRTEYRYDLLGNKRTKIL